MESADHSATAAEKLAAGYLLSDVELTALLGVSLQTVRNWRWKGEGPRWVRVGGRCIRYKPADVQAFIDQGQTP